jgi:hypothetical protein
MLSLLDDYQARHCDEWYLSDLNSPFDVHLTAYVKLLTLMADWKTIVARGEQSSVSFLCFYVFMLRKVNTLVDVQYRAGSCRDAG